MNNFKKYQNFILILLLFVFLSFLWLITAPALITKRSKQPAKTTSPPKVASQKIFPGKLSLSPASSKFILGQNFKVQVLLEAENEQVNASDAVLNFNPQLLEVSRIIIGDAFPDFPRKTFDNNTGEILLTGVQLEKAKDSFQGKKLMAEVEFRTKSMGLATVIFSFEKGSTLGSTVMQAGTSENILGKVMNGNYEIVQ